MTRGSLTPASALPLTKIIEEWSKVQGKDKRTSCAKYTHTSIWLVYTIHTSKATMLLHHSLSHAYKHRQFMSGSCYYRPCAESTTALRRHGYRVPSSSKYVTWLLWRLIWVLHCYTSSSTSCDERRTNTTLKRNPTCHWCVWNAGWCPPPPSSLLLWEQQLILPALASNFSLSQVVRVLVE